MKRVLEFVAFIGILLIVWAAAVSLSGIPVYLFPPPENVFLRFREMVADGILAPSIGETLIRTVLGFALAAGAGLLTGILLGCLPVLLRTMRPTLLGLQTLPSAAWVPLSLVLFGLHDSGVYFVIFMSAMPAMAIATADGVLRVPAAFSRAALTLGTPRHALWYRILIPASFPGMITGLRLCWTLGWHGAITAELIKSSAGLGFLLHMGRELADTSQILCVMLVIVLLGAVVEQLVFAPVERQVQKRWGLRNGSR